MGVRKNISREQGGNVLFDEVRYFFYITNDRTAVNLCSTRNASNSDNSVNNKPTLSSFPTSGNFKSPIIHPASFQMFGMRYFFSNSASMTSSPAGFEPPAA